MASSREMRVRLKSIKNISQVTKALETVSASKVRKAISVYSSTSPYSAKAWEVLVHLAEQTTGEKLHPLLSDRDDVNNILGIMITSDRGLSGAYNMNVVRNTLHYFSDFPQQIQYLTIGKKGRDFLRRRRKPLVAEFSNIPSPPSFLDISPIGRIAVDGFLSGEFDEVYLSFTEYVNMVRQDPTVYKLLPLDIQAIEGRKVGGTKKVLLEKNRNNQPKAVFTYEPEPGELLTEIVPRFISIQIYQAILSAQASEHAARMIAMGNATDNAKELMSILQMEYNKIRQQAITNDMLDIVGGVEAMSHPHQVTG
jgi:F-type H+-transporting ATPase subunit gamma